MLHITPGLSKKMDTQIEPFNGFTEFTEGDWA